MLSIQTILHPTDFSASAGYAYRLASAIGADCGADLIVVHVMATPVTLPSGIVLPIREQGHAHWREKADHVEISVNGIGAIEQLGGPADEILKLAQACHADLIVMGSHGRDGSNHLSLGSVAEAVMRQSACPVLTVTSGGETGEVGGPAEIFQHAQSR